MPFWYTSMHSFTFVANSMHNKFRSHRIDMCIIGSVENTYVLVLSFEILLLIYIPSSQRNAKTFTFKLIENKIC